MLQSSFETLGTGLFHHPIILYTDETLSATTTNTELLLQKSLLSFLNTNSINKYLFRQIKTPIN